MSTGLIYLLHFERPYGHARHYTGYVESPDGLAGRLEQHRKGNGARLLEVVGGAGIGWTLVRTWPGDRNRERRLKNQGGASRRCPLCLHPGRRSAGRAMELELSFGIPSGA